MRLLVLIVITTTALLGSSLAQSAGALSSSRFCRGADLVGRFSAVPGSAGAGNVSYALVLRNRSPSMCAVTGLPDVSLRSRSGTRLPTHVRAAFPGALTAVLVRLAPGQRTRATARFSPDVPGPGEPATAPCERTAYRLVVTMQGGGSTSVAIVPPTPVCEHGTLQFSAYGRP